MKTLKVSLVLVSALASILIFGAVTSANATTNCLSLATVDAKKACLIDLISELTAQIAQMKSQQASYSKPDWSVDDDNWCYNFKNSFNASTKSNVDFDLPTEILNVQQAMIKQGYQITDNPGVFGPSTSSALCKFQLKYASEILTPAGLKKCTGNVSVKTKEKLNKLYGCKTSSAVSLSNSPAFTLATSTTYTCTDSDGGKDTFVPGTTSGWGGALNNKLVTKNDYCKTSKILSEYYCSGYEVKVQPSICEFGCESGACKADETSSNGFSTRGATDTDTNTTATTNSITLTSPIGGERWFAGETKDITWTYTGNVQYVDIFLINDGAVSYIKSMVPASDLSYEWTIDSSLIGSKFKIKVQNNEYVFDSSASYFTISNFCTDSDVTTDYLDGVNYYLKGTTIGLNSTGVTTTKTDSCNGKILTEYSCSSDKESYTSEGYSCTNGCLNGACKSASTTTCTSFDYSDYGDCSNGTKTREVITSYPTGCTGGSPVISATCSDDTDDDTSDDSDDTSDTTSDATHNICNSSNQCVSVSGSGTDQCSSSTDCLKVDIISPDGVETWARGETHYIIWEGKGLSNAMVTNLSVVNDSTTATTRTTQLASGVSASSGRFAWTIPASFPLGGQYRVSITIGTSTQSVSDLSAAYFSVTAVGSASITLTSPNRGETWKKGETHDITWTSTGLSTSNATIYIANTDNALKNYLTNSVAVSNGKFSWTIPTTLSEGANYKIYITGTTPSGTTFNDYSDGVFSIVAPVVKTIKLGSPNGGESWEQGSTNNITWSGTGLSASDNVNIYVTTAGSTGQSFVAQNISAMAGLYSWTVPQGLTPGNNYVMHITLGSATDASDSAFSITSSASSVASDITFGFGQTNSNWKPIAGDWNGNGVDTVGVYDSSSSAFYLKNSNTTGYADTVVAFGTPNAGWLPIAGDWNADGITTIGLYDPTASTFYLKNNNTSGYADITIGFGSPGAGWLPIAGDWNADGITTIGLYDPNSSTFYLRNSNTSGSANLTFGFGSAGWLPVVGDWNEDGMTTIGLYNPSTSTFYLRNSNTSGYADITTVTNYTSGAKPIAGDWFSKGSSVVGVYNPSSSMFYLRSSNDSTTTSINKTALIASITDAINNILKQLALVNK